MRRRGNRRFPEAAGGPSRSCRSRARRFPEVSATPGQVWPLDRPGRRRQARRHGRARRDSSRAPLPVAEFPSRAAPDPLFSRTERPGTTRRRDVLRFRVLRMAPSCQVSAPRRPPEDRKPIPAAATQISEALSAQEVLLRRNLLKSVFPALGKCAWLPIKTSDKPHNRVKLACHARTTPVIPSVKKPGPFQPFIVTDTHQGVTPSRFVTDVRNCRSPASRELDVCSAVPRAAVHRAESPGPPRSGDPLAVIAARDHDDLQSVSEFRRSTT